MTRFCHLHVHTQYSLLDGLCKIDELIKRVKELGHTACAVTDHGCLYGLIHFYKACKAAGIKPILGCELYVVESITDAKDPAHLVVLARNEQGYKNLIKLATEAALAAGKRAIADHSMLEKYGSGLIAMSACLAGDIPNAILNNDLEKARLIAERFRSFFDEFYLELQPNSLPEQRPVNEALVKMSWEMGIPLSVSCDAHYILPEDAESHDVLLAIQTAKLVSDPERLRFGSQDFWIMSEEDVRERLSYLPSDAVDQAIENVAQIADQCNVTIELGNPAMPVYDWDLKEGETLEEKLCRMAIEGLDRLIVSGKIDPEENEVYWDRLEKELSVICGAGFAGYFLIVQDIVNWAKNNGIMVGPGRGSSGSSLLAYVLGITEVDPIKHNLIFERFLNGERALSDYDWTFDQYRPEESDKEACGEDEIALVNELSEEEAEEALWEAEQIKRQGLLGYYVRLAAQGVKIPRNKPQSFLAYAMGITDEKPQKLSRTRLTVVRQGSMPDIDVDIADTDRERVLEYVIKRYGHDRVAQIGNITTMGAREVLRRTAKAFGIPLEEVNKMSSLVPKTQGISLAEALEASPELRAYQEQYPEIFKHAMKLEGCASTTSIHAAGIAIAPCEITKLVPLHKGNGGEIVTQYDMDAVGDIVLKIDLLGLKTLSVIRHALRLAGKSIDALKRVELDDPGVYEMLSRGDTDGVFQVSSKLFKDLLREVKPRCFEDLVAVLSLGRPGPGSMAETYIKRRKGEEPVEYLDERLRPILEKTYSLPIFQEQVMQIACDLAGYTLGQADILRKAMGKKKPEIMEQERAKFISGCTNNGIDKETAEAIFNHIADFAHYSFNLAHATEYAIITYWTALLKLYYPAEFLTACLTDEAGSNSPDRRANISAYVSKARKLGIKILPPDINKSDRGFAIEEVDGRPAIRVGLSAIDGVGESAVDEVIARRPFDSIEDFISKVNGRILNKGRVEALIYAGCFDFEDQNRHAVYKRYLKAYLESMAKKKSKKPDVEEELSRIPNEFTREDRLKYERRLFGFPLSDPGAFASAEVGSLLDLVGTVSEIIPKKDKYGRDMCFFTLKTESDELVRVVVFAKLYRKTKKLIKPGAVLEVVGFREEYSLSAEEICPAA